MTSLRNLHREPVARLLHAGAGLPAAGNADAAVPPTAPRHSGEARIGIRSVP